MKKEKVRKPKKPSKHEFVYGGYELGSGGPIWCKTCGEDVDHKSHFKVKIGKVKP
jgi:hypothetical protein